MHIQSIRIDTTSMPQFNLSAIKEAAHNQNSTGSNLDLTITNQLAA